MPAFRLPRSAAAALLLLSLAFVSCASAQIQLPPTPNTTQGGQGGQDINLTLPTTPLPAESNATLPAGAIPTPALAPAYPGSEAPNVSLPFAPGNETAVPPGPGAGAVEPANATTPPVVITLPGATRKALPDVPANFTTAYNGTRGLNATAIPGGANATNATVGPPGNTTLLNLNATSGDKNASGVCFDRGFYHLSCYRFNSSSNTTVDDVIGAKTECLAAWAQTRAARGCNVSADLAGSNAFNCTHYFVYHFSALPCRTSYQNQERTNTNCSLYQSVNLSASKGYASLKSVDYRCGGTL